jgi:hypothetical protein
MSKKKTVALVATIIVVVLGALSLLSYKSYGDIQERVNTRVVEDSVVTVAAQMKVVMSKRVFADPSLVPTELSDEEFEAVFTEAKGLAVPSGGTGVRADALRGVTFARIDTYSARLTSVDGRFSVIVTLRDDDWGLSWDYAAQQ